MPFERPLSKVSETVDFLRAAFAGERTATGFRLKQAPAAPVPIISVGLRQMLEPRGGEGRRDVELLPPPACPFARGHRRARRLRVAVPLLLPPGRA